MGKSCGMLFVWLRVGFVAEELAFSKMDGLGFFWLKVDFMHGGE